MGGIIQKELEVERGSLEDLNRILVLAGQRGLKVAVIGGYAVRAYTQRRLRYTKDIDLAVKSEKDLPKLRGILAKIGYEVKERPHGLSGYRKVRGVAIVVNAIVEDVKIEKRNINSFYPKTGLSIKASVACIEDLLISKTKVWRERDIIDTCLLILDSSGLIDAKKLKKRLDKKQFYQGFLNSSKKLLGLIGTKKFHAVWKDFVRRKIRKEEEKELWKDLNQLVKGLQKSM